MTRPSGKKPASAPPPPLTRRGFLASSLGLCLATGACRPTVLGPAPTRRPPTAPAPLASARRLAPRVELHSWFDLPADDPRSREISGIGWDETTRTLWGVQDATANLVPLVPDAKWTRWSFGDSLTLKMSFPLDLEGVVVLKDGFIVASERGPRILEVDRRGRLRKDLVLPGHFAKARANKSLESLTMSPDARFLFTTSEEALSCDGDRTTSDGGSRLRILRIPRDTNGEYEEHAYATDPLPHASGDYGVADLAALSTDELLVLERGWTSGAGNTARIYRVSLTDPRASCLASPGLEVDAPVLAKHLVVDLAKLPSKGLPASKQTQASALLDNYEGLAVGPRLADGRQSLLLVSDDNGRTDQVARLLVLALG